MRRAIALLLPLLFSGACRTPPPGVPIAADDPRPAALLARLEAGTATRPALRGKARLDLEAPDLSLDRPQRMAVARPARLRVEVLGLFDQLAVAIVTDGNVYQVYDARNQDFEEGVVSAHLLWRFARVDLEPAEAVDLILGSPRPDPALREAVARLHEDGSIAFERVDAGGVAREGFRFDGAGRLAEMSTYDPSGELVWRARFSDYEEVATPGGGEVPFARAVALDFPRVEAKARLVWKRVVLVDDLPDALFALDLPRRPGRLPGTREVAMP